MFLTHLLQINIGYKHNNYFLSFIDYSILNVFFKKILHILLLDINHCRNLQ